MCLAQIILLSAVPVFKSTKHVTVTEKTNKLISQATQLAYRSVICGEMPCFQCLSARIDIMFFL
ncbi:hypothetical protein AAJ76_3400036618 [Vairimorpha ceranae]|uniref:Uncharacterized protein n=1 Tax=Vairimorpha ceranae TaxID=40302 RepID=A0A0F9YR76_9MICR|nr:hypothetical protein AAJ76_3400036618 [Vairimorpha ceranae]KKO75067.1 hypothetical protein AAJ76_3400036618 [Vairimorpha ceranae]